jgi:hypothetical protein
LLSIALWEQHLFPAFSRKNFLLAEQDKIAPARKNLMAEIEKKVVTAILAHVRKRRSTAAGLHAHVRAPSSRAVPPAHLREARFADLDAVRQLKMRWGLGSDSLANWEHLWRHNPALGDPNVRRPIGWVLEAKGEIVGYLGNISLVYHYGSRTLSAVAGTGFVAAPDYGIPSLRLLSAFYRQPSVDLFLASTANETSEKLVKLFHAVPLPQQDYDTVLFWVLRPYPFAQEVMRMLDLTPAFSRLSAPLASVIVGTDTILRRRWARNSSPGLTIKEIGIDEIGEPLQVLWANKLKEVTQLLADRTPASFRWHFGIPGHRGTTHVLGCFQSTELLGYVVIRTDTNQDSGLRRSLVADLLVKENNPKVTEALLFQAYQHSKNIGSHLLEIMGFPQSIRKLCSQWRPYSRKYPNLPFYYKAADPELHKALFDPAPWFASPFDGDTTLVP